MEIYNCAEKLEKQLVTINVSTDEEYLKIANGYFDEFIHQIEVLRDKFPELLHINYKGNMNSKEIEAVVETIKLNANKRFAFPPLPTFCFIIDIVLGNKIVIPLFTNNISQITCCSCNKLRQKYIYDMLLSILLSLPIKKVRFTIVDLDNTYSLSCIYKDLDPILYNNKPINQKSDFIKYLDGINNRILSCIQQYGDVVKYNIEHKTFATTYEVVILLGETFDDSLYTSINSIKSNGEKAGVYILDMTQTGNYEVSNSDIDIALDRIDSLADNPQNIIFPTHIQDVPKLQMALLKYINTEARKEDEQKSVVLDRYAQLNCDYCDLVDCISIPVGQCNGEEFNFCLDVISHPHAFVLGQTGTGKSVFLHNVISGAMIKYTPEDLELYLLDFKLGGVEFNRYKDEKHVHAMLVDNSDQQVTLEILRELKDRMSERGVLFRKSGVNSISEYNKKASTKMPQILVVADECHELFIVGENRSRNISNEINEIITKIAKEGRSQGVHLIFATQTLSNADISSEILNNISDHYLFKCALTDSERLVNNSSKSTNDLKNGQIYYHHVDENKVFTAYYDKNENPNKLMTQIKKKADGHISNCVFCFNGSSLFKLDDKVFKNNAEKYKRHTVAFAGKSIDLSQKDVCIPLRDEFSENILLAGLNHGEQTTRVAMNVLLSMLMAQKTHSSNNHFSVIDCRHNDESIYTDQLARLADAGKIELISPNKRGEYLRQLCDDIKNDKASETFLIILGQDKFRELKLDLDLPSPETKQLSSSGMITIGSSGFGSDNIKTYRQAMNYILDKGSEKKVHVLVEVERVSNILISDYITPKLISQKFKHLILLKSDERASAQLGLRDDIRLNQLCCDDDRLRAYYYSEESDSYTLFTPYVKSDDDAIDKIIK